MRARALSPRDARATHGASAHPEGRRHRARRHLFQVFASTCDTVHEPIVADIDCAIDVGGRNASAKIEGVLEAKGAPILNPITGAEHRVRIVQPDGFEFAEVEIGRGWSKTMGPIRFALDDSYGQFAEIHLCQNGMVRRER